MKIVSVRQNGKEWREWRGRGLGASDAPAIMGESPWQTPFELWLDKTGIRSRPPVNEFALAAMQRGTKLEPQARAIFEKKMGKLFPALSAEHDTHDFIRASFDGINMELNAICEIKCPGKESHAKAVKGQVPKNYIAQIQQQLLVSGLDLCYYVSWDGESSHVEVVEVRADKAYQERLLAEVTDFWKRVCEKVLPDVSNKDILKLVKEVEADVAKVQSAIGVFRLLSED